MEICRRSLNIPGLVIGLINHNKTEIYTTLSNPVFEIPSFNFDFMTLDKTFTTQVTASNLTFVTHAAGRYIYVCRCNNKYIFYIYDGRMLRIDIVSTEELEILRSKMVKLWDVLTNYYDIMNVSFGNYCMYVGDIRIPMLRDIVVSLRKAFGNPENVPDRFISDKQFNIALSDIKAVEFETGESSITFRTPDVLYLVATYPGGSLYLEREDDNLVFTQVGDISIQAKAICLKCGTFEGLCELLLNRFNDYVEVIYGKI